MILNNNTEIKMKTKTVIKIIDVMRIKTLLPFRRDIIALFTRRFTMIGWMKPMCVV